MPDELTAGEKLDRALNEKLGKDDVARLEAKISKVDSKIDALLQAMQNLGGRMEGRMDEMSKQLAARK